MPKWTNKGHEFDELGKEFQKNKNILILGYNIKSINDIKEKMTFMNEKVNIQTKKVNYLFYQLVKRFGSFFLPKNTTIVVAKDSDKILRRIVAQNGFVQNQNVFQSDEFLSKYLSVFALYVTDIIYSESQCTILTTICSLNCKNCLNFNPYIKDKKHNSYDEIIKSTDTYFKAFDKVGLFHVSGGETLMFPEITKYLRYVHENYSDRYAELGASSNLILNLTDEICEALRDCNVMLFVDDYTDQLDEKKKELFDKNLEKLKSFNVRMQMNIGRELEWFCIFPPVKKDYEKCDKALVQKFDACGYRNSEIRNGLINNCNYCGFASRAGIIEHDATDWYDLNNFTRDKKYELVEFRFGYSERGYVKFCKYCDGYVNINQRFVPVGEQVKGSLTWDKNNPHEVIEEKARV